MDSCYMRSRVRTRTHGSVGRREPLAPSDPIRGADFVKYLVPALCAGTRCLTGHRAPPNQAPLACAAHGAGQHRG
jgi:hypothetical protein